MGIKISRCFQVITPESAELSDFADAGFIYEDREVSFRELVRELKDFNEPSSYPMDALGDLTHVWACQSDGNANFRDGSTEFHSLHFSDQKSKAKYWDKALRLNFSGCKCNYKKG